METVEDCRLYVRDIVLLREYFVPSMKWLKDKVITLIPGIDNKVRGAELLVYNKNSEKTSKVRRPLQLIVPLEIDSLGSTIPPVSITQQEERLQKMLI